MANRSTLRLNRACEVDMRLTPLVAATVVVLLASLVGQISGAVQDSVGLSVFAATAFVGALLRTAWQLNRSWWYANAHHDIGPSGGDSERTMARTNALLLTLSYGWAGASLLGVYLLTPLRWQHGWQYGTGLVIIALLIWVIAQRLYAVWSPQIADALAWSTLAHSTAATGALAWLVGTGKIVSPRGDWAANIVFAGGGIAIVALSVMALRTARALKTDQT
jgi:hypothetical protein